MKRICILLIVAIFFCGALQSQSGVAGFEAEHTGINTKVAAGTAAFLRDHPDYRVMAENDSLALLLNEATLAVAVIDPKSGETLGESVMNGVQGNAGVKNLQKSVAAVTYLADSDNKNIASLQTMDSYSFCTELNNFAVREIPHGFELDLTLGANMLTADDLPKMIPLQKYNELLLPHFSSQNDKIFREEYRIVDDKYWLRVKDKDIGNLKLEYLYKLFFEKSQYTLADAEADTKAFGYVPEHALPRISLTVRYELDGADLVLTVPLSELKANHDVQMIEAAPYFLSAGTEDTGYLVAPDGSGALIYFNNGKKNAQAYQAPVFGADILKDLLVYKQKTFNITLPVYGIKKNSRAVLAIIEKGAELAEIVADVSGHADEFNRISSRFILRDIENVFLEGSGTSTQARWANDVYTGDLALRYVFLQGEQAQYAGMAKRYQQYLIAHQDLKKRAAEAQAPFFAECLGAIRKSKFFLGVSYPSTVCATTIPEGEMIYNRLRENGGQNIKFFFSGLYEGGVKNGSLRKIVLNSGMGSKRDFERLQRTAAESGGMLFPSVSLGRVYGSKRFSKLSDAPRRHNGLPAEETLFLENMMLDRFLEYPAYYVSPHKLSAYTETAKKNFGAWPLGGLAVRDLGGLVTPDYRRKQHLSRIHAAPVFEEVLQSLAAAYPLALTNPNSTAFVHASYITGLPSAHNGYSILDESIPFVQLVLDGCVPYAGTAWNGKAVLGMRRNLLHAIETRSSPYFLFTYQKETIFHNTLDADLEGTCSTYYADWTDEAASLYKEYNAFYGAVKDAQMSGHEILSGTLRRVRYTNGVTVYVNYGNKEALYGDLHIPAQGYLVQKE